MKIKTFLVMAMALVFAPLALAEVATETITTASSLDLVGLATLLFGDNGPVVIGWVSFFLVLWSQLRQLIPATWLAWLPSPLVTLLEWFASNLGKSANHIDNNPKAVKKMK
ncbi:hypothetical protein [Vibrio furnissii]|uniref:hypothetical protein n=1 Tax=Vibrio furnissii TaxID=29494 RepID=UPI001EE9DF33|nr:hypothetical protein [Vibrio furnissii]MCG6268299.1 hypothetical protein [Vibrio furnissii]